MEWIYKVAKQWLLYGIQKKKKTTVELHFCQNKNDSKLNTDVYIHTWWHKT